ncbi:hypothetical protein D3C74_436580 [compost metagenome]
MIRERNTVLEIHLFVENLIVEELGLAFVVLIDFDPVVQPFLFDSLCLQRMALMLRPAHSIHLLNNLFFGHFSNCWRFHSV